MSLSPAEIDELTQWRALQFLPLRKQWDILAAIWRGAHKDLFPDEFPDEQIPKVAGFIRRSAKMYARLIGQIPDIYVAPLAETKKGHDDQNRIEKILEGYNKVWDMEIKMGVLATFEVLFGAVGVGCIPDPALGYPRMLVEDARNCLPSADWASTGISGSGFMGYDLSNFIAPTDVGGGGLENMIIRKSMTARQIKALFPEATAGSAMDRILGTTMNELSRSWTVLMYYDATDAYAVLAGHAILLHQSPHGAPWCPWWFPTNFCFDSAAGDSDYYQQIGLEVAYSTLLSQKLALNDSVVWPWLAKTGIWEIDPDTRSMQASSPDAKIQTISPPPTFQVDRDMAMLASDMQILNMQSEATQGQLPGGPITGQGIQQLNQAPVAETVQDYFKRNSHLLPRLYATALVMDREVFGDVTKDISAWARGETFFMSYTPARDIGTRLGSIDVDFGPGLGGYQGHIAQLQDLGAEVMSKRSVMEKNRSVRSVRQEIARAQLEKLEAMQFGAMQGQLAVPMSWIAAAHKAVAAGEDLQEFIFANDPAQAGAQNTATPGNTPPLPPDIAAAMAAQGGGPPGAGGGPPGGGPGFPPGGLPEPTAPGQPLAAGGVGPGPNLWHPPAMSRLVGS